MERDGSICGHIALSLYICLLASLAHSKAQLKSHILQEAFPRPLEASQCLSSVITPVDPVSVSIAQSCLHVVLSIRLGAPKSRDCH